jgi:hypothetical protein
MVGIFGLLFWSAIVLAPVLLAVVVASRLLSRSDAAVALATLAVLVGFLIGGVVGWASVPSQWTASFWTTVDAAGDAVKYGHTFEHTAERALMYFLYSAFLGELASGVAALLVIWRLPQPRSARPSTS